MSTIPKVRPEALSGQAGPEQELVLPVPRLKELQALERQAESVGMGLEEWLLALLKANVTHTRPVPPQAHLVLRMDPGSHRFETRLVDSGLVSTVAYAYQGHLIWGATARVLNQFLEMLNNAVDEDVN